MGMDSSGSRCVGLLMLVAGALPVAACGSSTGSTSTTTTSVESDGGGDDAGEPSEPSTHPDAGLVATPLPSIDAGGSTGTTGTTGTTSPMCGGFGSPIAACNTCTQDFCCDAGSACGADASCSNLFACIQACATGDTTCLTACENEYPGGLTPLENFDDCLSTECSAQCGLGSSGSSGGGSSGGGTGTAAKAGLGDPCVADTDCASDLCNGHWCTTTCVQNTDCASSSTSITNEAGELVWCVGAKSGTSVCFPGCSSVAACAAYGSGITCAATTATNGASTDVCTSQ
jgi:hypothetical protein